MSSLMALSLGIGISCGIFSLFCHVTGISVWMGFVGCTSYFAVGGGGKNALIRALACNYAGVACAMLVIAFHSTSIMQEGTFLVPLLGALATACIAWAMTYISRAGLFVSVVSSFMGCFSTFASGGNWKLMLPSLACGVVLGFCCDMAGKQIERLWGRKGNSQANTDP